MATDNVAVKVRALSPSVTLLSLEDRVTEGGLSLSDMVIEAEVVAPAVVPPPDILDIETVAVSSAPS